MNALARTWRRVRNECNKLLVQLQNSFLRNSKVFGHPFQLTLEPGNLCNLRCPLCPTTHREERLPKGMLSLDNAKRIIDNFPYTVQMVLSNWGEPFLNKDIFEIIGYAAQRGIKVRMESNFTLFDEERAERLVASGLHTLSVALDGASQETYERYRVGGDFEVAVGNVEKLVAAKKRSGRRLPLIEWKFVVNRYNEHEVEAARKRAKQLGVDFRVVTIWAPEGGQEWLPLDPSLNGEGGREAPQKCHHLWQAVTVNFNGDVFSCCSEFAPSDRLSNALEQPFADVWNGADYQKRRSANRGPVNCEHCHGDKQTRWYQTWMANSQSPLGPGYSSPNGDSIPGSGERGKPDDGALRSKLER